MPACRRATGRVWANEKIHRAMSAWPDVPPVPRRHEPKQHEVRAGRAVPARPSPSPTSTVGRRPVGHVTLVVNAMDGIAYTAGSTIMLNAGYVNDYTGDVKTEVQLPTICSSTRAHVWLLFPVTSVRACAHACVQVTGVLYHETVHVWQWGLVDLRGDRRLHPATGRIRAGALGAARAGEQLGQRLRRHGEVPGLLRLAPAGLRRGAQRQADERVQRRLLRADPGQVRAGAVAGVQGQIRPSVTE